VEGPNQAPCEGFPCTDVSHAACVAPGEDLRRCRPFPVVLISEAAPADPADGYYASGDSLFARTTVEAFRDANVAVSTVNDLLTLGVYLTTAVKCAKMGSAPCARTIDTCSRILERELDGLGGARAILLMGDVAIRALNAIARRAGEPRVIPAGSTYRLRGGTYHFRGAQVFPSYLQAGPAFYIEKSKRAMIAQDIAAALRVAGLLAGEGPHAL